MYPVFSLGITLIYVYLKLSELVPHSHSRGTFIRFSNSLHRLMTPLLDFIRMSM